MKKITWLLFFALSSLLLLLMASACGGEKEENPFGLESEIVAPIGLADALAFAPDGRLFWADHWGGDVRVITADGKLLEDPVISFDVAAGHQWGLTGLALDPDFETNHYIYAYYTEIRDPGPPLTTAPVVVRFTEKNNLGADPKIIVSDLPDTDPDRPYNANGNIRFGPDGFLYITVGDYDVPHRTGARGKDLPQDLSTPIGKMLRVSKEDGSAPSDNPFVDDPDADPRIFAYGFHEPFDFTFAPQTGDIYGSDNTGVTCEELNLVEGGANYGWPKAGEWPYNNCLAAGKTPAIHLFAKEGMEPGDFLSVVSVRGLEFISGDTYPLLGDGLLVCEGGTGLMRLLTFGGPNSDEVASDDVVVDNCGRDIAISPDGLIYYSNETEIRRLVPVSSESE
jgi:glucose/arabinose dehydrogenase